MTQYPNQGYYDPMMQPPMEPAKRSGLAITALVLSLVGIIPCCVFTAPIGVLLGLIGAVTLGPTSGKKGRGMAVAAVIIGLIASAFWGWVLLNGIREFQEMGRTPGQRIEAAASGNLKPWQDMFGVASSPTTDAEAAAFIGTLTTRYGRVQRSEMDLEAFMERMQTAQGQQVLPFRYRIIFDNATVDAELMFDPDAQRGDSIVFQSITVFDARDGNLTYPPSASPATVPATAPAGSVGGANGDGADGGAGG